MAVISRQFPAYTAEVEKAIYLAQQVIIRNLIIQAKILKEPFRCCLCTHHLTILLADHSENGITISRRLHGRLNQQNLPTRDIGSSLAVVINTAILAHRVAGGGTVHSIMNRHCPKLGSALSQRRTADGSCRGF